MDAIEPILPRPPILPGVQPAQRSAPVHRDGGNSDGEAPGDRRRRGRERDAVEVDVDGTEEASEDDAGAVILGLSAGHRVDPTAALPVHATAAARRVDLIAEDSAEPPVRRIDLSA